MNRRSKGNIDNKEKMKRCKGKLWMEGKTEVNVIKNDIKIK
jgi:hypothetical protein